MPPHHGIGSNDGERVAGLRKQAAPRINLSTAKNDIRFGLPRRNTMICCLSTRLRLLALLVTETGQRPNRRSARRDRTSNAGSSDSQPIANRIRFTTGTAAKWSDRSRSAEENPHRQIHANWMVEILHALPSSPRVRRTERTPRAAM